MMNAADIPLVEPSERGRIAYTCLLPTDDEPSTWLSNIFAINANGTNLHWITNGAKTDAFHLSPSGTKIVFINRSYQSTPDRRWSYHLCIIHTDGTNERRLETAEPIVDARWLDSSRIVYTAYDQWSNLTAYVTDENLAEPRLLAPEDMPLFTSPLWIPRGYRYVEHRVLSPDGTKIAFRTADQHGNGILDVVDAGNGDSLQLEHANNEYNAMIPAWSPDSTEIAFITLPPDDYWDRIHPEALHIMNVKSGNVRKVIDVDFGSARRSEIYPYAPAWSPDGSRIMFIGLYEAEYWNNDIYLINPDGSDLRRVTTDGLPKASLAWLP